MPLKICVDFIKTFDTMNREAVWNILRKLGYPSLTVKLESVLHNKNEDTSHFKVVNLTVITKVRHQPPPVSHDIVQNIQTEKLILSQVNKLRCLTSTFTNKRFDVKLDTGTSNGSKDFGGLQTRVLLKKKKP